MQGREPALREDTAFPKPAVCPPAGYESQLVNIVVVRPVFPFSV